MLYVEDAILLSTRDLASVVLVLEGQSHGIELHVKPAAARGLAQATGNHIGKPLAMFIDGRLNSAPAVMTKLSDVIWLNGAFTDDELMDIAKRLNAQLKI